MGCSDAYKTTVMKPILNEWQWWFKPVSRTYNYIEGQGWHLFDAGFIKIINKPEPGYMINRKDYKGIIFRFTWWFPIDRAR